MKAEVLSYPAKFRREKAGGYSVSFPDFPEAHTQGETRAEAFQMAMDCLAAAIEYRLEEKTDVPSPSGATGRLVEIPVPLQIAPKLALHQALRESKWSNMALARRLGVRETVVRRMLDPRHASKPEQYTKALSVLGRKLQVSIVA